MKKKELQDSQNVKNTQALTDKNIHNSNEINSPDVLTDRKEGEDKKINDGHENDWNSLLDIADDQANSDRVIEEF